MNRAEFIENLAARLETNKAEANKALNGVLDEIRHAVSRGEEVRLSGLGFLTALSAKLVKLVTHRLVKPFESKRLVSRSSGQVQTLRL